MVSAIHGVWCNTRTFPARCRYCQQSVFYFHCDCDSKVFFDSLGWPWPIHDCLNLAQSSGNAQLPPRPSGRIAQTNTMRRVTISSQSPNYGLMPGTIRASESMVQRVRAAGSRLRETMRIDPTGSQQETQVGRVIEVHKVDIAQRLRIERRSVLAGLIDRRFPNLMAVQITILVDELDIDPDAEDLFSFTFWCEASPVSESIMRHDVVHVEIAPMEILGNENRWVAESIEIVR